MLKGAVLPGLRTERDPNIKGAVLPSLWTKRDPNTVHNYARLVLGQEDLIGKPLVQTLIVELKVNTSTFEYFALSLDKRTSRFALSLDKKTSRESSC